MLDIVTMDESAVSFHMLNTATVKAVDEYGEAWTVKAKVPATRSKQMVVAFIDNKRTHLHQLRPQEQKGER
jgi:hypothetical protein